MNKIIKLKSGLRIALHKMESTRSVAIGVFVNTGSAYETPELNGIAHFIEHMLFKGTEKRSAFEIAEEMEFIGAQINAFTSREITCFYTISTDSQTEKCMDILSDIFFNSQFSDDCLAKEKGVVLEEINMCEDDPSDLCLDNLSLAHFGESGFGRPILGTKETVESFTSDMLKKYVKEHYTADNVVVSIAGNISYKDAEEMVRRYFDENFIKSGRKKGEKNLPSTESFSNAIYKEKQIEQANIALSFPSYSYSSGKNLRVSLMNYVLGGGMSSRLFQKLREDLGIVYDVYTSQSEYVDCGFVVVYLATNPQSAEEAVNAVRDVILNFAEEGITEREFLKGKEQLKASLVLGAERSVSIMRAAGGRAALLNKTFDLDERLKEIDALTIEEVNETAKIIFDVSKVSASYVGKNIEIDLLNILRK